MVSARPRVYNSVDLVNASSPLAIESTLIRLRPRFRRWKRWLTSKHQYKDVVDALEPKSKSIHGSRIAEYIACSAPLHVSDGWVFLARAFDAVRSGDGNTAVHLAYYAELRAAMSLLASEGIGIFNHRHVAIDATLLATDWGNVGKNKGQRVGTHQATWEILDSWANDPSRASTILNSIVVDTKTISEWFDDAHISTSVQHLVARQWLSSWSLDLKLFPKDRDLRNHTSYRPSQISPDSVEAINTTRDVIDPMLRTWDALEPSADTGGAAIDRALLFHAMRLAYNDGSPAEPTWDEYVDRLHGIAPASLEAQLRVPSENEYYVLRSAGITAVPPPMQAVLARGTLLLRIANAVCAKRFRDARISKEDLQFWLQRFGDDKGLWSEYTDIDSFADLWPEVDDARDDAQAKINMIASPKMSDLGEIFGQVVALTQYSRAPLWLLGVD